MRLLEDRFSLSKRHLQSGSLLVWMILLGVHERIEQSCANRLESSVESAQLTHQKFRFVIEQLMHNQHFKQIAMKRVTQARCGHIGHVAASPAPFASRRDSEGVLIRHMTKLNYRSTGSL